MQSFHCMPFHTTRGRGAIPIQQMRSPAWETRPGDHGLTLEQALPLLPTLAGVQRAGLGADEPSPLRGTSETGRCELRPGIPVRPPGRAQDYWQVVMGLPEQGASRAGTLGHQGALGDSHSTCLGGMNSITNQSLRTHF